MPTASPRAAPSSAPGVRPLAITVGIPAAPTKASLLFDMVVSCSSLQGSSWLEAAGAVSAENQVLRLQAVAHQELELQLAQLQPFLVGVAAHGTLAAAGRIGLHHCPVVADVVACLQAEQRVPAAAARVGEDPSRVTQRVPELVGQA